MRYSSLTAVGTTVARASFNGSLCRDPLAPRFLNLPLRLLTGGLTRFPPLLRFARFVADRFRPGLVTHLACRTEHFDRTLDAALDSGIDQVVILGAGFDSRAWRFDDSRHIDFFEVDQPSTQERKRKLVRRRLAAHHSPVFVPVDLRTDNLVHALIAAGFSSTRRSFFLWEDATTLYDDATLRATLEAVRSLASRGSELAIDLVHPHLLGELGWHITELLDSQSLKEHYLAGTPFEPQEMIQTSYVVHASL